MMPRRRHAERGITLVEVLVAITLTSLIATGVLMALRMGVFTMTRTNAKLQFNRRVIGAQRILESELGSIMFVRADCQPGPGRIERQPFFEFGPSTMRFVSNYSIQNAFRGQAIMLEFAVIPGENGEGFRLIVNEIPYTGARGIGSVCLGRTTDSITGQPYLKFLPVGVNERSFVLADKLGYCRFLYKRFDPIKKTDSWFPRWTFDDLPSAIRVEMQPLAPTPGAVPLLTVTMPVHINRDLMTTFEDE